MKKYLFLFLAASALTLACSREALNPSEKPAANYPVQIDPILTKVTETDFENGDAIGLTVTRQRGAWASNAKLVFDSSTGAFAGDLLWYDEGADEAELFAYYPYVNLESSSPVPGRFTVATDQQSGTSSSDLIFGTKNGVLPSAHAISMEFKHKLSRVVINVTNNAGYTIGGLTLKGSIPGADIRDFEVLVNPDLGPADIQMFKASATQYQAIVVPQTVAFEVEINAAGVPMKQKMEEMTLLSGKQYTINMIVNPTNIKVALSGAVANWDNGGVINPDDSEIVFEEHLNEHYFIYHNQSYSVKQLSNSLWIMTQSMRFVPDGMSISEKPSDGNGIWYPYSVDGTVAVVDKSAEGIQARGLLYTHEVAFGAEITADNYASFEGCQGICPAGWHIPTYAEFLSIVGAANALDSEHPATTDASAVYYDADYKAARIKTMNADGFNWDFAGSISRNNNTVTGAYSTTITKDATCSVADWIGKNAMTFYMGSTGHPLAATNLTTNRQFMSLMSTFTGTYPEGKVNVGYSNYLGGYALRCIRDHE